MQLVLASANRGKQRELAELLAPLGLELRLGSELGVDSPEETGTSFEANALLKARHAAVTTGLAAIADDSGLEVDALGGAPGIHSARYAGVGATDEANNARLLAALAGRTQRAARYRCVLVLLRSGSDPAPLVAHGAWEGRIAEAPAGTGGFGYDPLFIPLGEQQTVGELPAELKARQSHRAQAARELVRLVRVAGIGA